jgi:hypothetical protein
MAIVLHMLLFTLQGTWGISNNYTIELPMSMLRFR